MNTNNISAVLLAGGKSSRMGTDKATLLYNGKSFLEVQSSKLRSLGIEDIIVSGYGNGMIPDEIPGCGPVGGLYTCLQHIRTSCALVLPIDTPLISSQLLSMLIDCHFSGSFDATLLAHAGEIEPLISIYTTSVVPYFKKLIDDRRYSLRRVLQYISWQGFEYSGDIHQIKNFNTPEDYSELSSPVSL